MKLHEYESEFLRLTGQVTELEGDLVKMLAHPEPTDKRIRAVLEQLHRDRIDEAKNLLRLLSLRFHCKHEYTERLPDDARAGTLAETLRHPRAETCERCGHSRFKK